MKKLFFILSFVLLASCTTDEIENDKNDKIDNSIKGIWVTQADDYNRFLVFEDNGIGASFQLYNHKRNNKQCKTRATFPEEPNPTITVIDNNGMHYDLTTGDTYVDKGVLTVKMFTNASEVEGYRLDCKWKLTDDKTGKYWFEHGSNVEIVLDKNRVITTIQPIITYTVVNNEEIYWSFGEDCYEPFRIVIEENVSYTKYMSSFRYFYDNQEQTITFYDTKDYIRIYNIVEHNTEKLHISNAYQESIYYKYDKSLEDIEREYDIVLKFTDALPF